MDISYPDTFILQENIWTLVSLLCMWIAPLFYAASSIVAFISLRKGRTYLPALFYILLITGFVLQSSGLYFRGLYLSAFPLTNIFEILQVIAWGALALMLIIQIVFRLRLLGLFGSGFVTLLTLFSLVIIPLDSHKINDAITGENLSVTNVAYAHQIHAALAIFAYSIFGLLAITSLMFLLQDYSLTHKRFGGFFERLPSLKQLNSISGLLLFTGVISLALSVILGTLIWLSDTSSATISKLVCAWILFIGYLTALLLKEKQRYMHYISKYPFWQWIYTPRTLAWACIFLFLFALLTLWPLHFSLSA